MDVTESAGTELLSGRTHLVATLTPESSATPTQLQTDAITVHPGIVCSRRNVVLKEQNEWIRTECTIRTFGIRQFC